MRPVLLRLPARRVPQGISRLSLPPETAALVRELRRGRGGDLFPSVVRPAPDGLVDDIRPLDARDAQVLADAFVQPAFAPWVAMIERLGAWCRTQQAEHAGLLRAGLLRPGNADLFAPLVGGAFVRCAIGGAGCAEDVERGFRDFRAFFERFARRLERDLRRGAFGGEVDGPVVAIRTAASETHNGRQRVLCVRMRGGFRMAYKPRPVDGEEIFLAAGRAGAGDPSVFDAINRLGDGSGPVRLPTLRVWRGVGRDRRAYSWQEWIEPPVRRGALRAGRREVEVPVLTPRAASAYWRSGGALAVVCHAFGVTDLGDGNLMAGRRRGVRGVLPYIVDLEIFACPLQRLSGTGLVEPVAHRGHAHPGFPDRLRVDEAEAPAVGFFEERGGGLSLRSVTAARARRQSRTVIADTLGNVGYAAYLLPMLRGMFDTWTRMGLDREGLIARLQTRARTGRSRVLVAYTATYARELERMLSPGDAVPTHAPAGRPFSVEERVQLGRGDVPYFFAAASGGGLQWMGGIDASRVCDAGPQVMEEASLRPDPAMLDGHTLEFVRLAVPIQDAIAYVYPQLLEGPDLLRDDGGLRLRDPALGVDVRLRDETTGTASFDWPAIGRRVTFAWTADRIRVDAAPLPPPPARSRAVAARLMRIGRLDAPLRAAWATDGFRDRDMERQLAALTAAGLAWLVQVVEREGWPTEARVGRGASRIASQLAQHAGRDALELQRQCLQAMRAAAALGEVPLREVAYLSDAVRLNEGRRQRYGTKFRKDRGGLRPCPLEAPATVDVRRRRMGLAPLSDYRRVLERRYRIGDEDA
ncbi:DUF4135 domain-containing protein [Luteimonas abyssi]|uniref:DUF4135 domain-containing protein n=1 Tax=Luteimonas abyssi TaxID=1247514 RepID=UPI000A6123B3|nr:DUF4135 domain-containing protein [Luteimonas abyssi]